MNGNVNRFILKHSQIFIYLLIFLLLFLNGMRFNQWMSLCLAFVDTMFFAILYQLLCKIIGQTPTRIKRGFGKLMIIIFLIFIFGHIIYYVEYFIIRFLPIDMEHPKNEILPYINLTRFLKDIILCIVALCLSIFKHANSSALQAEELKQERNLMQLQLLQSQINPHFLFNALNNIYALVYTKNDIAPDALMKLSDMLRYVTDYGQQERVAIDKDLAYIGNYVDFQILRLGNKEKIQYQTKCDAQGYFIPPMLLQPFVENCFNHSDLSTNKNGFVRIFVSIHDDVLNFSTENSISASRQFSDKHRDGGVGLKNVEQRLQLYYPDAYQLYISTENDTYKVNLQINLK